MNAFSGDKKFRLLDRIWLKASATEKEIKPQAYDIMQLWGKSFEPIEIAVKYWEPKNPEIQMPVAADKPLDDRQWKISGFPFFPVPEEVTTNVRVNIWEEKVREYNEKEECREYIEILNKVLQDLTQGCDSRVLPPGTSATVSKNYFPEPSVDIPRIADAIASELKSGHMAGPFKPGSIKEAKINGFISIKKPNGARRQVGNLSDPLGLSFNDNIDPRALEEWKVHATTAREFGNMLMRAGKNCNMSCSDMVNAYKNLPVKKSQRRLQVF